MISCILAVPCGHLKLTEENGFITACDWTEEAPFPAETALLKKAEKELEEYGTHAARYRAEARKWR